MKKIRKNIRRYKYLYIVDIILIFLIFLFPMEDNTSKFVSSKKNRIGYILDKDATIRQGFKSELKNIERISLMVTTTKKKTDCKIYLKLINGDGTIADQKVISNDELSYTSSLSDSSTDYVNFYLKEKMYETIGKNFFVEINTNCDSIIKVQFFDAEEKEEKAIYNGIETNKKMAIRYSGTKKSINNMIYIYVIFMMTAIIIIGGKNEKK